MVKKLALIVLPIVIVVVAYNFLRAKNPFGAFGWLP